jgi:hypothetical protein
MSRYHKGYQEAGIGGKLRTGRKKSEKAKGLNLNAFRAER